MTTNGAQPTTTQSTPVHTSPPPATTARVTPMANLTPTGRVILGMLALGNRTGYDIKRVVGQ